MEVEEFKKQSYRVGPLITLAYDGNKILIVQTVVDGIPKPRTKEAFLEKLIDAKLWFEVELGIENAKKDKNYKLLAQTIEAYIGRNWNGKLEFITTDGLEDYLKKM